jgi:hypothetical protein
MSYEPVEKQSESLVEIELKPVYRAKEELPMNPKEKSVNEDNTRQYFSILCCFGTENPNHVLVRSKTLNMTMTWILFIFVALVILTIFESILLPTTWYICRAIYENDFNLQNGLRKGLIFSTTANDHVMCHDGNFPFFSLIVNLGVLAVVMFVIIGILIVAKIITETQSCMSSIEKELESAS